MSGSVIASWDALGPLKAQVLAFVLTSAGAVFAYFIRPQVKIIWGNTTNSYHKVSLPEDKFANIYSEKFYIQNTGKAVAESVNVIFSKSPTEISIFPPRKVDKEILSDGSFQFSIEYISPQELVIVDTIDINIDPTILRFVNCKAATGKRVSWWVARQFSSLFYKFFGFLIFLGVVYLIQLVLRVVGFLVIGIVQ